jgi:hypothetical protein
MRVAPSKAIEGGRITTEPPPLTRARGRRSHRLQEKRAQQRIRTGTGENRGQGGGAKTRVGGSNHLPTPSSHTRARADGHTDCMKRERKKGWICTGMKGPLRVGVLKIRGADHLGLFPFVQDAPHLVDRFAGALGDHIDRFEGRLRVSRIEFAARRGMRWGSRRSLPC